MEHTQTDKSSPAKGLVGDLGDKYAVGVICISGCALVVACMSHHTKNYRHTVNKSIKIVMRYKFVRAGNLIIASVSKNRAVVASFDI